MSSGLIKLIFISGSINCMDHTPKPIQKLHKEQSRRDSSFKWAAAEEFQPFQSPVLKHSSPYSGQSGEENGDVEVESKPCKQNPQIQIPTTTSLYQPNINSDGTISWSKASMPSPPPSRARALSDASSASTVIREVGLWEQFPESKEEQEAPYSHYRRTLSARMRVNADSPKSPEVEEKEDDWEALEKEWVSVDKPNPAEEECPKCMLDSNDTELIRLECSPEGESHLMCESCIQELSSHPTLEAQCFTCLKSIQTRRTFFGGLVTLRKKFKTIPKVRSNRDFARIHKEQQENLNSNNSRPGILGLCCRR